MKNDFDQKDKTLDQDNKGNISRSKFDLDQIDISKNFRSKKIVDQ